jgi:hypothetical protein
MTDAAVSAGSPKRVKPPAERHPWDQQPRENDLWYARFLRFIALGPGRSVSLVATGRRNAYPVPAHWPIQSKQNSWRERATAFDEAVVLALKARNTIEDRVDLLETFTNRLMALASTAPNGEAELLQAALQAGGYQLSRDEDEDYDEAEIVNVKTTR